MFHLSRLTAWRARVDRADPLVDPPPPPRLLAFAPANARSSSCPSPCPWRALFPCLSVAQAHHSNNLGLKPGRRRVFFLPLFFEELFVCHRRTVHERDPLLFYYCCSAKYRCSACCFPPADPGKADGCAQRCAATLRSRAPSFYVSIRHVRASAIVYEASKKCAS